MNGQGASNNTGCVHVIINHKVGWVNNWLLTVLKILKNEKILLLKLKFLKGF